MLNGTNTINDIQGLGSNIFPEIYEKLLDKEDLSFYCLLGMLTNFKYQTYSNIVSSFYE